MRPFRTASTFATAGLLVGMLTGAAGIALAQDSLALDPDAALAIEKAQIQARKAELDEREARLEQAESGAPCEVDVLASVSYGPPIPDDIDAAAIAPPDAPMVDVSATSPSGSDSAEPPITSAVAPTGTPAEVGDPQEVAQTLKAMKPKKAALVVVQLDSRLAAEAMTSLSARNRARILDHVPPAAAASITAALGESP